MFENVDIRRCSISFLRLSHMKNNFRSIKLPLWSFVISATISNWDTKRRNIMGLHETFSVFASRNNRMTTHKVSVICRWWFVLMEQPYLSSFNWSEIVTNVCFSYQDSWSLSAHLLKVKGITCVICHKYSIQIRVSITENWNLPQ